MFFISVSLNKWIGIKDIYFCEGQFLKAGGGSTTKRKRRPSPSSSSSSDNGPGVEDFNSHVSESKNAPPETISSISEIEPANQSKTTRKAYNAADSVIWDIERDSHIAESHISGQKVATNATPQHSLLTGSRIRKSGSESPLSGNFMQPDHLGDAEDPDAQDDSVISLRPSESASHILTMANLPHIFSNEPSVVVVSKFFSGNKTLLVDQPSFPDSDPVAQPLSNDSLEKDESVNFSQQSLLQQQEKMGKDDYMHSECVQSLLEYPESFLWPASNVMEPLGYDISVFDDGFHSRSFGHPLGGNAVAISRFHETPYYIDMGSEGFVDNMESFEFQENEEGVHFEEQRLEDSLWALNADCVDIETFPDESEYHSLNGAYQQIDDDGAAGSDHFDRFAQGRALLFGFPGSADPSSLHRVPNVEEEVAYLLRQNHWTPQRL